MLWVSYDVVNVDGADDILSDRSRHWNDDT